MVNSIKDKEGRVNQLKKKMEAAKVRWVFSSGACFSFFVNRC